MKHKKHLLAFLFITFFISDCKKYSEDDKWIHLRTVKARLCRSWSTSPSGGGFDMVIYSDGNLSGTFSAKWSLTDKKNKFLITDIPSGKTIYDFTIKKLDPKELWLQNDSLLLKFIPWKK